MAIWISSHGGGHKASVLSEQLDWQFQCPIRLFLPSLLFRKQNFPLKTDFSSKPQTWALPSEVSRHYSHPTRKQLGAQRKSTAERMLQYSVAQQSVEPGSTPLCNQPALGQLSPGGFSYKVFWLLRQNASQQIIPLQIIPRVSLLITLFIHPKERVFCCDHAAVHALAPTWLQQCAPGSDPKLPTAPQSPQLPTTDLFTCLLRNLIWSCRSLRSCSHSPSPCWKPTECWFGLCLNGRLRSTPKMKRTIMPATKTLIFRFGVEVI